MGLKAAKQGTVYSQDMGLFTTRHGAKSHQTRDCLPPDMGLFDFLTVANLPEVVGQDTLNSANEPFMLTQMSSPMISSNTTLTTENYTREVVDPVSDDFLRTTMFVNYGIIGGLISLVGVVLNAINITVFIDLGFSDTINISLLGLAVADTGGLASLVWMSLCYNPLVTGAFPEVNFNEIQHLTAGWPHVCFMRISSWLTAFITFERYLCISVPLKVKALLTREATIIAVSFIFLVVIATIVPVYVGIYITSDVYDKNGKRQLGFAYISGGQELLNASVFTNSMQQLFTIFMVILCTSGLVYKMSEKSQWRNSATTSSKLETINARDKKVVRLVIIIAVTFIATFTPFVIYVLAMFSNHEFMTGRKYQNLFLVCGTFAFNMEAINASCSFFIYLKMSSKFRNIIVTRLNKTFPYIYQK
ncbi:hypothetical protein Btru_064037 [Bulinus truncatus]|nr:hypothetical protein Btru_064037 [Bulinus truncatus]